MVDATRNRASTTCPEKNARDSLISHSFGGLLKGAFWMQQGIS